MGCQLLICVETNKSAKTDELYIQELILRRYGKITEYSIKYIEMSGCTNLNDAKAKINKLAKEYKKLSASNESHVICCFDTDDYDKDYDDICRLENARKFCEHNGYIFVWFCRDIEEVFWNQRVDDKKKKEYAKKFRTQSQYKNVKLENLHAVNYSKKKSNILNVLDDYLAECK